MTELDNYFFQAALSSDESELAKLLGSMPLESRQVQSAKVIEELCKRIFSGENIKPRDEKRRYFADAYPAVQLKLQKLAFSLLLENADPKIFGLDNILQRFNACHLLNHDMLDLCLERGLSQEQLQKLSRVTQFIRDPRALRALLEHGLEVSLELLNFCFTFKGTAPEWQAGDLEIVKLLLDFGADFTDLEKEHALPQGWYYPGDGLSYEALDLENGLPERVIYRENKLSHGVLYSEVEALKLLLERNPALLYTASLYSKYSLLKDSELKATREFSRLILSYLDREQAKEEAFKLAAELDEDVLQGFLSGELGRDDLYYGQTPLFWAARRGDLQAIDHLLTFGFDSLHEDKDGSTALLEAVRYGQVEAFVRLFHHQQDPNVSNGRVLTVAVHYGRQEIIRYLHQEAVDINKATLYSPIVIAVDNGDLPLVRLLIELGAKLGQNMDCEEGQISLLALKGNLEIFAVLIEAGAPVHSILALGVNGNPAVFSQGRSLLLEAIEQENMAALKVLIDSARCKDAYDEAWKFSLEKKNAEASSLLLAQMKLSLDQLNDINNLDLSDEAEAELAKQLIAAGANCADEKFLATFKQELLAAIIGLEKRGLCPDLVREVMHQRAFYQLRYDKA